MTTIVVIIVIMMSSVIVGREIRILQKIKYNMMAKYTQLVLKDLFYTKYKIKMRDY